MSDELAPDSGRLEQILRSFDHFKPVDTRRSFMQKLMVAGAGAAVAATSVGKVANVFASVDDPVLAFVNAAVGAERIGIAFYGNALGSGSPYSFAGDPATNRLLNSSHREYFRAAFNQESSHLAASSLTAAVFPSATSDFRLERSGARQACSAWGRAWSRSSSALTWAVKVGATAGDSLGIFVAGWPHRSAGSNVSTACSSTTLLAFHHPTTGSTKAMSSRRPRELSATPALARPYTSTSHKSGKGNGVPCPRRWSSVGCVRVFGGRWPDPPWRPLAFS
jgi:hypothetical protein